MTGRVTSPSVFEDTDSSENWNKEYIKKLEDRVKKMDAEITFLKKENGSQEQKIVLLQIVSVI
jgi:abortive infection bacteriophage resistance protein